MTAWNADAKTPRGETSMDVLMKWLSAPGNYSRWQSGGKEVQAKEIAQELHAHGIMNRSPKTIVCKILRLETQFEAASDWLVRQGQLARYHSAKAAENVKLGMSERCSVYSQLTTIFQKIDPKVGSNNNQAKRPAAAKRAIAEKKQTRENTLTKRPRFSDADLSSDGQDSLTDKRVVYTSMLAERFEVTEDLDGHREVRYEAHRVVKHTTAVAQATAAVSDEMLRRGIAYDQAIAKCHIEAEQKREELRTTCEKLLSRHQLRRAGIQEDVVRRAIPE